MKQLLLLCILALSLTGYNWNNSPSQTPATPPEAGHNPSNPPDYGTTPIIVTVGGQNFAAALYNNNATDQLAARFPLTLQMEDVNGNEKFCPLATALPTQAETPGEIHSGDIMLYGKDGLVLFYDSFSSPYSYTRLGAIEDGAGFAKVVGRGSVTITFSGDPN